MLADTEYEVLTNGMSSAASDSSASTYEGDMHLSGRVPLSFSVKEERRVYLRMGNTERRLRRISDLPGIDRVLRPSDTTTLRDPQVRLYRKFTRFLMENTILFSGPFQCASRLCGATHTNHNGRIMGDRPVPVHVEELEENLPLTRVTNVYLGRHTGTRICHVSDTGTRRPSHFISEKVIYLGLDEDDHPRCIIPEQIAQDTDFHLCADRLKCGKINFFPGHRCGHSLRCMGESIEVTLCAKDNSRRLRNYIVESPAGFNDEKEFLHLDYETGDWEVFGYSIEVRLFRDVFRQTRRLVRNGLDALHTLSNQDKVLMRHAAMACPRLFEGKPGTCFATLSQSEICEVPGFTPTLHDLLGRLTIIRNGTGLTTCEGVSLHRENGVYHCTEGAGYQSVTGLATNLLVVGNIWQKYQLKAGLEDAVNERLEPSIVLNRTINDYEAVEFVTLTTGFDLFQFVDLALGKSDDNVFIVDMLAKRVVRLAAQKWGRSDAGQQRSVY